MDAFVSFLRRMQFDETALANVLLRALSSPIVTGVAVDVTLASGATTATFKHGLGRLPVGGVFVSSSDASQVVVVDPSPTLTEMSLTAASAPLADVLLRLWVF